MLSRLEAAADSPLDHAVVSDGTTVYSLLQDGYGHPDGGGEIAAQACTEPSVEGGALQCAGFEPDGNHYRVCGHDGGQNPKPLELPE